MSMQSHIAQLSRRHQALEKELETVLAQHSADDLRVVALKRRKLSVKDEIERLRQH